LHPIEKLSQQMKPPKSTRQDVFVQYKLWLSNLSGESIIGENRLRLLQEISDRGSLSAAALALGVSYRKAWGDLRRAEELLGYPLTVKHRGGQKGGCSELTPAAKRLLEAYDALKKELNRSFGEATADFRRRINE
jgi:molybdate transport system regulatory protein